MVNYIVKHKAHDRMKMLSLFKDMEEDKILPGRTAKGLINHFRKITSFQLRKYCDEENFKIFERVRKRKPITPKKRQRNLATIMFEDEDGMGDDSDFLPDQFKQPPKKQQKIPTYFSCRTQSQKPAAPGPSQVIKTHENIGQRSTQIGEALTLQPILKKNEMTDNVWLRPKPSSCTKLVSKSQPVESRNLPIKLVSVRIGSQRIIPKSSQHLNDIPDFCMNTEMYSKTEDRHILESLVRHVSNASDLEDDDFWRNLKRWVLVPGRSCESVRARFHQLQRSDLSHLGVAFAVLNKLNLCRNASKDPLKKNQFQPLRSQKPGENNLPITRPDSPPESYLVDNNSLLDASLEESKYHEPRTVSPPAAEQTTRKPANLGYKSTNQAGTLQTTRQTIPPSTSRLAARTMPAIEPVTLRQPTHNMPMRQAGNKANSQQQNYLRSQQAQSKPTPSSPAKSVKPFRKAVTGVAVSQHSQQITECTFEKAGNDISQEEFSAHPYFKSRPRTAISECSGITNFQVHLTSNSKTIDVCAQKKLNPREKSHCVHIETTTIQRKVLSHTFRSNYNDESNSGRLTNKSEKKMQLKDSKKVLSDNYSEDSGSETRKQKTDSQVNAAVNDKSQANYIQESVKNSNKVTRHTQIPKDDLKNDQTQKEHTVFNLAANDDDDDDTVLAPNFVSEDEQQLSEPENVIYSSDSILDVDENEVLKSKNKTLSNSKSKESIIDQCTNNQFGVDFYSQDSELLAHMASQRIDTANSIDMNTQMTHTPDKISLASFNLQKIDEEDDYIFQENSQKDGSISPNLVSQSISHTSSSAVQITTEGALKIQHNSKNYASKTVPEVIYLTPQGSSNQNQDCIKYIKAKPSVPQQQVVNVEGQLSTVVNNATMSVFNPNVIFMIPEQPQQLQQPISNVYNIYNSNKSKFRLNKKRKLLRKAKCNKWVVTNVCDSSETEEEKIKTKKLKKSDKCKAVIKKKSKKTQSKMKKVSNSESENEIEKIEDKSYLNKATKNIIKNSMVLSKQAVKVRNVIKKRVNKLSEVENIKQTRQRKRENASVDPHAGIRNQQNICKLFNSSDSDSENEEKVKLVRPKYINTRLRQKQKLNESQNSDLEISGSKNEKPPSRHKMPTCNELSKHEQKQCLNKYAELKELEKLSSLNEDLLTSDSSFSGAQLNSTKNSGQQQFERFVPASDSSASDEELEREIYVNTRSRRWKDNKGRKQEQRRSPRINIGDAEMERLATKGKFI